MKENRKAINIKAFNFKPIRKLIRATLLFSLLLWVCSPAYLSNSAQADSLVYTLAEPYILKDSRTLVPMRSLFETFGASVEWQRESKSVLASTEKVKLVLQVNQSRAFINGKPYTLDVPPIIQNGRTYVPIRFISEALGASVTWDATSKTVVIHQQSHVLLIKNKIGSSDRIYSAIIHKNLKELEQNTNGTPVQDQPTVQPVNEPEIEPVNPEFIFSGITLGDSSEKVFQVLGSPVRSSGSKYGFEWRVFHHQYEDFLMVGIHNGKVVAIYSNSNKWSSKSGLKVGTNKSDAISVLGVPLEYIRKGNTRYYLPGDGTEFHTFSHEQGYVTVFYDVHKNSTITSIYIIDKEIEDAFQGFYATPTQQLQQSYELDHFDLTNALRVREGKAALKWHEALSVTARKHSNDMATHHYFDHINLAGLSPFDRMLQDGIQFKNAGENLTVGFMDAIYAHEALFNSYGHRINLLGDFTHVGIGVQFNTDDVPYHTQKFITP